MTLDAMERNVFISEQRNFVWESPFRVIPYLVMDFVSIWFQILFDTGWAQTKFRLQP